VSKINFPEHSSVTNRVKLNLNPQPNCLQATVKKTLKIQLFTNLVVGVELQSPVTF